MAWGLREKVVAAMLTSISVVGATSLLLVERIERQQRIALTRDAAENFVLLHKARLLAGIQYDLGLARKLADAEPLRRWILAPGPDTLRPALRELRSSIALTSSQAAFYSSTTSASFHYLDLAAADALLAADESIIPVTQTLSEDDPESAWFYKTLNQPQPYIFNVDYNTQLDITKLWINVVMRDGATPIGVVGTGVDISTIVDALLQTHGEGVSAMFINARGEIEGEFNPALFGQGVAVPKIWSQLGGAGEREALEAAMIEVESGRSDSRSLLLHWDDRQQVAALAFLPELQWFVLTLHDPERARGNAGMTPLLLVLLGAVLVSGGLIALFGNLLLFVPLRRLTGEGERLLRGETAGLYPMVAREDELGTLAQSMLRLVEHDSASGRDHSAFSRLVAQLQQATDEAALAAGLFADLAPHLRLGQASLYRADLATERLVLCGGYARLDDRPLAKQIAFGDGLLGQCAGEQRAIDLIPPPADFLRFGSALGDGAAQAVLLRPLMCRDSLVGVLELATREPPSATARALLDDLLPVLGLCLDNLAKQAQAAEALDEARRQAARLAIEQQTASEQRVALQRLLDNSPVCIAFSANDRFRYVNAAFESSFGHGAGRSAIAMYARPDDRPRVVAMLQRDGVVRDLELPMVMADGSHRSYRVTLIPYVHQGEAGILGWLIDLPAKTTAPIDGEQDSSSADSRGEA